MVAKNTKKYIENKKAQGLYGWESFSHPGETLKDEFEFLGLTQVEVAARTGCAVQTISRIVNEKEPISPNMALRLERVFGGRPNAEFWLNMQSAYDQKIAMTKEAEKAEGEIDFFKTHLKKTYRELQKLGLFEKTSLRTADNFKKAVLSIKSFFEASTLLSIHDENILGVAFRKYDRKNLNRYNLAALLKIGEKKARKVMKEMSLKEYDKARFLAELPRLKSLTKKEPSIFLDELQCVCRELGVIVIYVPNMAHTYLGGASTWLGGHPVIILKVEKQWADTFWFNFFHEAGHILKHSKKEFFVDFENGAKTKIETEADTLAQKTLIPDFKEVTAKLKPGIKIESWLEESANSANVSQNIIAGRVCNDIGSKNAWRILSKFRPTIKVKVEL